MGNQFCNLCENIYPPLLTDEKHYLLEMQEYPKQILESVGSDTLELKHKASIEYYEQRRTLLNICSEQEDDEEIIRKRSCEILLGLQQTRNYQYQKSNSVDQIDDTLSKLTFDKVYNMHPWVEIPNCPGRYIIKKGQCSQMSIEELVSNNDIKIKFFENKNYRDKIGVVTFQGGAILTYFKNNDQFVHTLNNISGFKRKLNMLGIIYEELTENLIAV